MYDLKDRTYAVLEVGTIGYYNYIKTKKNKFQVRLNFPTIIEMAAVKIKNGKIVGNYSTFVNIDGCDEYDLKFDNDPEFDGNGRYYLACNYEKYDNLVYCRIDRNSEIV